MANATAKQTKKAPLGPKNKLSGAQNTPSRVHWYVLGAVSLVAYLLFVHPDVIETANHSYVLLESTFSGRFLQFYNDVMAHNNTLYYINNAHYNIFIYIIFALAELPVFAFNSLFGTAVNEAVLYYIGKLVSAAFFAASIPLVAALAAELGLDKATGKWAALFFALWPPAFFSALVMGQYDSLCLFFTLLALLYWLRGNTLRFALWMGVGAACKFFPLLLFIPLLLLSHKKIVDILRYGVAAIWLLIPTTLLFIGRTGDMGTFNSIMVSRLFSAKIAGGAGNLSLFPILYIIVCIVAYFWRPEAGRALHRAGLWLCIVVYGLLFLLVDWHPQWIILAAPFLVLSTFMEKNRTPWFIVDVVLSAGFFLWCAVSHPHQLEANLVDFSIIGKITALRTTSVAEGYNAIVFYYDLLPVVSAMPLVLFSAALIAHMALKHPARRGTPAARLWAGGEDGYSRHIGKLLWLCFGASIAVWLVPTAFTWLKAFSFI